MTLWPLAMVVTACGNNVVAGAGGTGTGGATTSSSSTSPSGGVECSGTYAELGQAVDEATTCNPALNSVQCSGQAAVTDACGCAHIANEQLQQAVAQAQAAYTSCVSADCCGKGAHPITPPTCATCATATSGLCDPSTNRCVPQ